MQMITRYLFNVFKIFLFYLIVFALFRLVFLLYFHHEVTSGHGTTVMLQSLYKAIPLDISAACYLLFLPLLILFFADLFYTAFFIKLLKGYVIFTLALYTILAIAEIGTYQELHVKLYYGLLTHIAHITEVLSIVPWLQLLKLLLFIAVLFYISYLLLNLLFPTSNTNKKPITIFSGILLFLVFSAGTVLCAIGSRGGLQPIPINEGEVYFSANQYVNDATVNPLWNVLHSTVENALVMKGNAYKAMDDSKANEIVNGLYAVEKDTTIHLFKVERPNICILILESWTADFIHSLGGFDSLSPNFEKLAREGYFFTNIEPTGHVSDQGVPAVLSGYPALPTGSVINQPEKVVNLPCLNDEFSKAGYYSSFFFGGQLIYGDIKTYIYRGKYNRIIEQEDLPKSIPSGRLGIHDSIMLNIWRDSLDKFKQPFFSGLFTLSTHPPFDEPNPNIIHWAGDYNPLLNSVIYSDRQLGRFFEEAKKAKWYNNTIFILVADHGHGTPREHSFESPEFYHIPLLIWGGALKEEYRGIRDNRVGSQIDIASTILHQLNLPSKNYKWSKNLMNPYTKQFAYYTFLEGFGYSDTTGNMIWSKVIPRDDRSTAKTIEERQALYQKGAAMLQMEMKDFLSK